jgi:hypothetical protein
MKTRVSKAYRNSQHVGWRKTIGGVERFLQYGTSPSDEAKAIALAEILEAKWRLAKAAGESQLSETDVEDAKALVAGVRRRPPNPELPPPIDPHREQPRLRALAPVAEPAAPTLAPANVPVRHWLYPSIDEFIAKIRLTLKPDGSNGDNVCNVIARINRAKDAIADVPLDQFRRKELEDWLLSIRGMPSKFTGQPLGAVTIRNLVGAVRAAMTKFIAWEWWQPPLLWDHAFKDYSIKKLESPTDRKRRRRKPQIFTVEERRVLWHFARSPFNRSMMALAEWAGHTQTEIATLTRDEVKDERGEMYVERDRNKTGVHGRWWIPPEAAVEIRQAMQETPRDKSINPLGLSFLTICNKPLVHRAMAGQRSRSDYVGGCVWPTMQRLARQCGVKPISFKGMRKATAQLIRDEWGKEVSRTFLAHADEDIQDEHYTRACFDKVERALRALHEQHKGMFLKIRGGEWDELEKRIREAN